MRQPCLVPQVPSLTQSCAEAAEAELALNGRDGPSEWGATVCRAGDVSGRVEEHSWFARRPPRLMSIHGNLFAQGRHCSAAGRFQRIVPLSCSAQFRMAWIEISDVPSRIRNRPSFTTSKRARTPRRV